MGETGSCQESDTIGKSCIIRLEFSTRRPLATLETSFLEAIEVEVRLQSIGERMGGEEIG